VLALVLLFTTWFAGSPARLPVAIPAAALLGLAALCWERGAIPRPRPQTLVCLGLAVAYRLPALLSPWGFVNKDGAYGAFVALHLLQGEHPAPVFTEGANYQGTLKPHLAALLSLVSGCRDFSFLMLLASLCLYLVFIAATMALARRLAGAQAALVAGLYLAIAPRFLSVFSLNCVGQYVDVLALGGLALLLLARLLDDERHGVAARRAYLGIGALLGAAFWQQPVALSYVIVCAAVLLLWMLRWRDVWVLLAPLGVAVGALPLLLWNLANDWATGEILGRSADHVGSQAKTLPSLLGQTFSIALPRLAGLSPGHPWAQIPGVRELVGAVIPLALLVYIVRERAALRRVPTTAWLTPLLSLCCLALFWAVASGRVFTRPRYLLPLLAATAVQLGVCAASTSQRHWAAALVGVLALLSLNAVGTLPRLLAAREIEDHYERLVQSLERKGIRTGYADFSIAAPVTMFTNEAIVLSPALGPTPAYESPRHTARVLRDGPDAFVLLPGEDPEPFARVLRERGITFRFDPEPLPVFYQLSAPVRVEDVRGFRGETRPRLPASED
jgi:hypothetical protein